MQRRGHHRWVLWRLGLGVLTVFLVLTLVFIATQALPTDPARAILGSHATQQQVEALRKELNLDRPLIGQYLDWVRGVVQGDFGDSLAARIPVSKVIQEPLMNTLVLVLLSALIALPVSVALGVLSAIRRDRAFDYVTSSISLVLAALPDFVIGLALVILFGTTVLTVLPAVSFIPAGESAFGHPRELVLPVATLVLVVVPYLFRLVRGSMIDVLESEYVEMARLKGLPERKVIVVHALPNALVPAIQGSALVVAYLAGGVVVVEYIFNYPGVGRLLTDAIGNRDLPVIQAITLILAAAYVLVNLLADVLTVYVTPRLRTAQT